jgi:Dolichyl-phosphate-mannose-protein mannosyltransferase
VGVINNKPSHRTRIAICGLIFLLAFGVRILSWHDTRLEVGKVQTAVTADYKRVAQLLGEGGVTSFLSRSSPLADLNNLGHPPGYSILLALINSVFGGADSAIQFFQITADSLAAVFIFLIVAELLPLSAGVVAGLLAALSPQFAWNSVLLLPDSLCVLPILLAVYLLTRTIRKPRLVNFFIIGALVGISCWLRANAMLLSLFLAAAVPLLASAKRPANFSLSISYKGDKLKFVERQWRYALAVVFGTLLIILPLTFRNAIVVHRFIPVSLGAGQTLLEGIADYDTQGTLGIPRTDVGIMKQEAEQFGRPDYSGTLFNPDGVERERARLARGFAIIRSHPLWFSGVMARRAGSMVRLERARRISTGPPVSHSLDVESAQPVWSATTEMLKSGISAPAAKVSYDANSQTFMVEGDETKYGEQFSYDFGQIRKNTDYLIAAPITVERGRMRVSVRGSNGTVYASEVIETLEGQTAASPTIVQLQLPFVAVNDESTRLVLNNEASDPPRPVIELGVVKIFELGPARYLWTRYPRYLIRSLQKAFLTAVILPLAIIGLGLLVIRKKSYPLVILMVVPVYYFCVQAAVHTEYRYVLAVDYLLFALVGVTVSWLGAVAAKNVKHMRFIKSCQTLV